MDFVSIDDVGTWFANSGFADWEWFDGFDEDDLIRHIWQRFDSVEHDPAAGEDVFWSDFDTTPVDEVIADYIRAHGDDPALYSL